MTQQEQYDTYLSYSSEDREWVEKFATALRDAGVTNFFDIEDILPGESWEEPTEKALRGSRTLISILSSNSVTSPSTYFDLGVAIAGQKRIIPILIDETEPQNIPKLLSNVKILRESSPERAGKRIAEVLAIYREAKAS